MDNYKQNLYENSTVTSKEFKVLTDTVKFQAAMWETLSEDKSLSLDDRIKLSGIPNVWDGYLKEASNFYSTLSDRDQSQVDVDIALTLRANLPEKESRLAIDYIFNNLRGFEQPKALKKEIYDSNVVLVTFGVLEEYASRINPAA